MGKQKSSAEQAEDQYIFASDVKADSAAVDGFEELMGKFAFIFGLDEGDSIVAIRDYAQYRLAVRADERLAETRRQIVKLEAQAQP